MRLFKETNYLLHNNIITLGIRINIGQFNIRLVIAIMGVGFVYIFKNVLIFII